MKKKGLLVIVGILFCFTSVFSQERTGKIGLSTNVQELQFDLIVPIWITKNITINPSFGFLGATKQALDISLGLGIRKYLSEDKFSPYIGLRGAGFFMKPHKGDTSSDFLTGLFLGGEYFIESRFSIGVEGQINATFSDKYSNRFGNPDGINFNTATALYATFYFK